MPPFSSLAMLSLALCGCASPGFPRAPSLHLPAPVTDLSATRIADRVELRWTAPASSTDGLALKSSITVELCRDPVRALPGDTAAPPCTAIQKVAGHTGPSTADDHLPPSVTRDQLAPGFLAYRVRVLNSSGRAAPPTVAALVPAGPSLEAVASFNAVQIKDGVLLQWQKARQSSSAAGSGAVVEVLRTDRTPTPGPDRSSQSMLAPKAKKSDPPSPNRANEASAQVRLQPDAAGSERTDSPVTSPSTEGMIDRSPAADGVYTYQARRVLSFPSGGKTIEMFSESTAPVSIAMRDTFAPQVPRGLVSVPGTMRTPAALQLTIDLSWKPNSEVDLAGYLVYRTDVVAGLPTTNSGTLRLTASPVVGPAFRDVTVVAGRSYQYRITAVDRSGNESLPSAPVQDSPEGR